MTEDDRLRALPLEDRLPERGQLRKQIGPDSTPDPTPLHIFASVDAVGSEWPHPGGPTTSLRWGAATGQAASALTLRG